MREQDLPDLQEEPHPCCHLLPWRTSPVGGSKGSLM